MHWRKKPLVLEVRVTYMKKVLTIAGSDCSGACSTISLASIITVIISCFRSERWSIAAGAAVYFATSFAAKGFIPTSFLSPAERVSHEEIAAWLRSTKSEGSG